MHQYLARAIPTLFAVAVTLFVLPHENAVAQPGEPVKPNVLFIMDVSGSMDATGNTGGPESCSGGRTRMDHAKCALQQIVNGYGDITIALSRFRQVPQLTNCVDCDYDMGCNMYGAQSPDQLEVLVPLVDGNQNDVVTWLDFSCGTCTTDLALNPEITFDDNGITPLAGSLYGAERYWQGLDPTWMGLPGGDPIRDDPLNNVFIGGAQCRPYITVLLTDGEEVCATNADVPVAAADLYSTPVSGLPSDFRIETVPIGFGLSACDTNIEAIAHAGGAPDDMDPLTCEGYYANNEAELAVAMSQIIADSLKSELCNGVDDDCDVLVDEDFTDIGATCDNGLQGECFRTGNRVCAADLTTTTCMITNPGPMPGANAETCNGLDDDCDGRTDEAPAMCAGCADAEICDNMDNDCDLAVDEGLDRECGTATGECTSGTETCVAGMWQGCTATGPFVEACDGLDNNCDGVIDGIAQECSDVPGGNPGVGICQAGIQVCPSDGSGMFGQCFNEVQPQPVDECNNLDEDCDGAVDEGHVPVVCNALCGLGMTSCVNGVLECEGMGMPEPESCDGLDNDCDLLVDEDVGAGSPCDDGGVLACEPGVEMCIGGVFVCVGGQPGIPEVCDCNDNDCDGPVDEDPDGPGPETICPTGQECRSCQCVSPCQPGEFACPVGQFCEAGFCLPDPCFGVDCPAVGGVDQTCDQGTCRDTCDVVTCPGALVCRPSDGTCQVDDCVAFPEQCNDGEACIDGQCVNDPCLGVNCTSAGEYCYDGNCVETCSQVDCAADEVCVLGVCQPNPCGGACEFGEICDLDGPTCENNPCDATNCPDGRYCDPQSGICEPDPCTVVTCPNAGEVCFEGTCDDPPPPYMPPPDVVTPGGGGGCATTPASSSGMWLILIGLMLATLRRRKISEVTR